MSLQSQGIAAVVILGLAAMALLAWWDRGNRDCRDLLPTEASISLVGSGAVASSAGGSLGATRKSQGAQNENQSNSFLVCKDKQDPDSASIGPSSLGQVANQWRTTTRGLNIHIRTATAERILENFEMDAAADIKQNIMLRWCRKNALCVSCEFEPTTGRPTLVSVSLNKGAATRRMQMVLDGPALPAVPPVTYEDIEDGKRFVRQCELPKS